MYIHLQIIKFLLIDLLSHLSKTTKPRLGHVIEALAGRRSYPGRLRKKRRRWWRMVWNKSHSLRWKFAVCVFLLIIPCLSPFFRRGFGRFCFPMCIPVSSGDLVDVYPMLISIIGWDLVVVFFPCLSHYWWRFGSFDRMFTSIIDGNLVYIVLSQWCFTNWLRIGFHSLIHRLVISSRWIILVLVIGGRDCITP